MPVTACLSGPFATFLESVLGVPIRRNHRYPDWVRQHGASRTSLTLPEWMRRQGRKVRSQGGLECLSVKVGRRDAQGMKAQGDVKLGQNGAQRLANAVFDGSQAIVDRASAHAEALGCK